MPFLYDPPLPKRKDRHPSNKRMLALALGFVFAGLCTGVALVWADRYVVETSDGSPMWGLIGIMLIGFTLMWVPEVAKLAREVRRAR